jgi:hypothetical protein
VVLLDFGYPVLVLWFSFSQRLNIIGFWILWLWTHSFWYRRFYFIAILWYCEINAILIPLLYPPYRPTEVPSWSWSYGCWIYNYLHNQCLSPLKLWVRVPLMAKLTGYNFMWKVCQWLATGWWFSPGTPFSSNNKTDRHDTVKPDETGPWVNRNTVHSDLNFKSPVFSLIIFDNNHWINRTLHIPNSDLDLRSQYTNYCYNLSP